MGFGQKSGIKNESDLADVLPQVTTEDVLTFGLIPELIGRLPVTSALSPLDEEGLVSILTEPRNSLVKQYQSLFEMENATLEFDEAALAAIASRAMTKGTGARGLRSIIEQVMLDIMYELPDQESGASYHITEDVIEGRSELFKMPKSKSA